MRRRQEDEVEESMACPSFRTFSETARDPSFFPYSSPSAVVGGDGNGPVSSDDFEFTLHNIDNSAAGRRWYPVFGMDKTPKKVEYESSESEADVLDGLPPGTYCVWKPEAKAVKKSRSVGSGSSRSWSLRDLVFGRSRSDGKERFMVPLAPAKASAATEGKGKKNKASGVGAAGGGRRGMEYYGRDQDRRRTTTFLPYRRGLLGLFPARSS